MTDIVRLMFDQVDIAIFSAGFGLTLAVRTHASHLSIGTKPTHTETEFLFLGVGLFVGLDWQEWLRIGMRFSPR